MLFNKGQQVTWLLLALLILGAQAGSVRNTTDFWKTQLQAD